MSERRFKSRVIQKHDIEAHWLLAKNFIPEQGEIIVYDTDETYSYERFKIGDGIQNVSKLPFVDAELKDAISEKSQVQMITMDGTESITENLSTLQIHRLTQEQYDEKLANGSLDDSALYFIPDEQIDLSGYATVEAVDQIGALVGDTPVSTQISSAIADKANKNEVIRVVTATSDDGIAYVATIPDMTELTLGARFVLITETTSKSITPTLNVNGLGVKNIRRSLSTGASVAPGYATGWITKNKPYMLVYDGLQWLVEGQEKPVGLDLYGPVQATEDINGNLIVDTYATKTELQNLMPKVTTISLPAADWNGDSSPYYQVVAVNGVTENSKVDLQITAMQFVELQESDIAFTAENNDGIVTVYSVNGKPEVDYTIQALISEVVVV